MFKVLTETALVFVALRSWEFSRSLRNEIPWKKIPLIIFEHGLARKRIDAWFKKKRIQPNIYAQVAGNEAILSLLALGCGIGIIPRLVFENSPLQKNILILDIKPELSLLCRRYLYPEKKNKISAGPCLLGGLGFGKGFLPIIPRRQSQRALPFLVLLNCKQINPTSLLRNGVCIFILTT